MDPQMQIAALNPLCGEDVRRQDRWAFLTEGLDKDIRGYARTDPEALRQRKVVLESLLDNQLRMVMTEDGPHMLPLEFCEELGQQLKEGRLYEAGDGISKMGWLAPASNPPSTSKIFTTQALGLTRRVFPKLIAMDLLSTQPMSQPTGKVFHLDFIYNEDQSPGITGGTNKMHERGLWVDGTGEIYADTLADGSTSATTEGGAAREMYLDMGETSVTARSKKLAADWSVEIQQDLRAYHGLSADSEMMQALSKQITYEIDRTLLTELENLCFGASGAGTVVWNKGGYDGTDPVQQRAWDETLYDAVEDGAALIEEVKYVKPQWLVMGVRTGARFRKLNGFRAATSDDFTMSLGMGARTIFGTVANRWFVYVDPWMDEDKIMIGYKGNGFGEAGHVYAPYIPMFRTPQFTDPKTFVHSRGIMSRFGSVTVNEGGKYYAGVNLTDS